MLRSLFAFCILANDLRLLASNYLFYHGIATAGTFFPGRFVPGAEIALRISFAAKVFSAFFGFKGNNRLPA
jgi:hypothetical protein